MGMIQFICVEYEFGRSEHWIKDMDVEFLIAGTFTIIKIIINNFVKVKCK